MNATNNIQPAAETPQFFFSFSVTNLFMDISESRSDLAFAFLGGGLIKDEDMRIFFLVSRLKKE